MCILSVRRSCAIPSLFYPQFDVDIGWLSLNAMPAAAAAVLLGTLLPLVAYAEDEMSYQERIALVNQPVQGLTKDEEVR